MKRFGFSALAVALVTSGVATFAPVVAGAAPAPAAVYDSIGATVPSNVSSVGFEATATKEFGDLVQLAPGARQLTSVDLLLSSWGCQFGGWNALCTTTPGASFTHSLTLNIYRSTPGVGTGVGALVATKTQTFTIPYRPSSDLFHCTSGQQWWDGANCKSGLAVPVTFTFANEIVPTDLIWTVTYNTTHAGYSPIGESAPCYTSAGGCGYDSLNIGAQNITPNPVSGTDLDADSVLWNTTYAANYTDGGTGGVGVNRFDTNWTGYRPTARINTVATSEAETTQVVKAVDTTWVFAAEGAAGSTGAYVAGPGTAPLGTGSAEFTVNATNQSEILAKSMLGGTKLTDITEFAYSSHQPSGSVTAALQFNVSFDNAAANAPYQGRLVYEPTYTVGTLPAGWQRWDTLAGKWWATNFGGASGGLCVQASPCTWSQILTLWPNARINPNPAYAAVLFKLGAGPASFTANVDHLTIGVDDGAGNITVTNYDFEPTPQCTTECYVDANDGNDLNGGTGPTDAKKTINAGIAAVAGGGTVHVADGTYNEDVSVNKSITLIGAGADQSTIVGPIGGPGSTVTIAASNVVVEGFTITRDGNNATDWSNPNLNTAGVAIQGQSITNTQIRKNTLTGLRTGIDINNSNGNKVTDNVIDFNRTGAIFRNQTDDTTFTGNFVTNNYAVGIVFLDASGGTNVPVQTATGSEFSGNNISGNWYGGVVDRQSGGSLPAPGSNVKDFSGNWWGTNSPVVTTANSAEPAYAGQIPVLFGGTAVPPGGQPDIAGPASANVDFTPRLDVGTDLSANVGFQGSSASLTLTAAGAQTGSTSRVQEGVTDVIAGGTVHVTSGDYPVASAVNLNKAVSLLGPNTGISPNDPTTPLDPNPARGAEAVLHATAANVVLQVASADVTIDGFTFTDPGTTGTSNLALIGGQGNDVQVTNNLFDGITGIALYLNGSVTTDGAIVDDNRVANPDRAAGCGAAALANSACGRQLFNLWQVDHASFQDNVVFAPTGNGDRTRVLQVSFPNAPSAQSDSPAANFLIDGNTIRNACTFTCFSVAIAATNVEITNNDVEVDTGNIVQLRTEWNSGRVLIDHNSFVDPNDYAITLDAPPAMVTTDFSQLTITRNSIVGGGVRNLRAETATAQCNWWGQAGGALPAQNSGAVDATNALIASNLDGPCNSPTSVTGVAGNSRVTVSWVAPTPDGTTITGYIVTASPGGATCTTSGATSCTVLGLTNGTPYTFTVVGTTTDGNSPPSAPSAPVTPLAPPVITPDFNPVNPDRVVDTRVGAPNGLRVVPKAKVGPSNILEVKVSDLPGGLTPASGIGAVSLNVTVTDATAAGFLTVYSCGTRNTVSNLNFAAGSTVPNAVITPISATGTICIYSSSPVNVLVDINGWFKGPGGFTSVNPDRVVDTRVGAPNGLRVVPKAKVGPSNILEVKVSDLPGGLTPASGIRAVSLNVTATDASAAGFLTVYGCGTRNTVSNLNYTAGSTVPNTVITPISATGTICIYSSTPVNVLVDINGWFADPSDLTSVNPDRVVDTRVGAPNGLRVVPKAKVGPSNILEVKVSDLPGGLTPAGGISAVSLNVTALDATTAGFVTVYSCGTRNTVSNLNYTAGGVSANAVLTPISATGTICIYSSSPADILIDLNGWFAAAPV